MALFHTPEAELEFLRVLEKLADGVQRQGKAATDLADRFQKILNKAEPVIEKMIEEAEKELS